MKERGGTRGHNRNGRCDQHTERHTTIAFAVQPAGERAKQNPISHSHFVGVQSVGATIRSSRERRGRSGLSAYLDCAGTTRWRVGPGQPKVRHLQVANPVHKYVLGFEVTVHDATGVAVLHREQQLVQIRLLTTTAKKHVTTHKQHGQPRRRRQRHTSTPKAHTPQPATRQMTHTRPSIRVHDAVGMTPVP